MAKTERHLPSHFDNSIAEMQSYGYTSVSRIARLCGLVSLLCSESAARS